MQFAEHIPIPVFEEKAPTGSALLEGYICARCGVECPSPSFCLVRVLPERKPEQKRVVLRLVHELLAA